MAGQVVYKGGTMGDMARQFEVVRTERDKLAAAVRQLKADLQSQCKISLSEMDKSDALQLYNEDGSYTLLAQNIWDHSRSKAFEEAIAVVYGERLSGETGEEADVAYNNALDDAVRAIKLIAAGKEDDGN